MSVILYFTSWVFQRFQWFFEDREAIMNDIFLEIPSLVISC